MKRIISMIIFLVLAFHVNGQSIERWVISPFGNNYDNNFQVVQATLGELAITAVTDSISLILTQGFHQPAPSKIPVEEYRREIVIYPNPVQDKCSIQFYVYDVNDFNIDVWDLIGNILYKKRINDVFSGQVDMIDFTGFIQGIYFIRVYSDRDEMETIEKIIKL